MDLKWLEDFLSLARTGSFSKSAAERHVTQSAFSRRIKALERWLGAPLVDRSTYPTRLTEGGQVFREVVEEVLRRLYEERDRIRDIHGGDGVVSFSAIHTLALTLFPRWIGQMEAEVGPIQSRLVADNIHNCVQLLVDGTSDFLLCFAHPDIPFFIDAERHPFVRLGDDRLVPVSLAGRNGRPLYRLGGRSSRPLPYLAYAPDSLLGRAVELILDRQRPPVQLHRRYENSMAESLKTMALEGHGMAWLPESSVSSELADGRLLRAGGGRWEMTLEVRLYRSADRNNAQAERLWAALRDCRPAPA